MNYADLFLQEYPTYKEHNFEQLSELDEYIAFIKGFDDGRKYYAGQVIQVCSDTWFQFNGKTWHEMDIEEQIEWSRLN